jgi:hypothetical protein
VVPGPPRAGPGTLRSLARRAKRAPRVLALIALVAWHLGTENATMTEVDIARPQSAYRPAEGFFDELFDADGRPRPHAAALAAALRALGPERLAAAGRRRDAIFVQQGITFDTTGEDGPTLERPFPLDLVPRILPASEWTHIKRGLAQRIRALNRFVDDVYHAREIDPRRHRALAPRREPQPLRARRARDPAAGRRLLPRRRLRPRP